MSNDKNFQLKQCTKEEVDAFNLDLQTIIAKHGVELRAVPIFVPNNVTGKFEADAQVMLFKKVELIPKEDNGTKPTEPTPEAPATPTESETD